MIFAKSEILFALVVAFSSLAPMQAVASNRTDAMAPVHQLVDGFNKYDLKWAVAACTDSASVIDDFPPHVWQSCANWADGFNALAKKESITDAKIILSKPRHVDVTDSNAYVVAAVTLTYKLKGKPKKLPGIFTASLHKEADGWRITGWAWADL